MNIFNMGTVVFSSIISAGICTIVIGFLWLQNRGRFDGLGLWMTDFVMQFAALLLVGLRGKVPDFVSMTVSNALVIGGTIILFAGLEQFVGKRGRQIHNIVLLLVFMVVHTYFIFVYPSLDARNINFSLGVLIICAQCAWLIFRRADKEMRSIAHSLGMVFIAFCLVSIVRILVDLIIPSDNDFFHSNVYDTTLVMLYQMLFIVLTFSLFLMMNRRLITDLELDIAYRKQTGEALRLSEEKFHKAFHSSPDAFLITRISDGKLVEVNEGFSHLTGYSPEETLASSSINLRLWAYPKDRDAYIADLMEKRRVREREFDFRTKSGNILNCLISGEIMRLGDDDYAISVVRDITERKQTLEFLRESERRYRSLFENMLGGYAYCKLIYVDGQPRDFIYLEVNSVFEKLTGLNGVIGKRVTEIIPGVRESNPELFEIYGRVVQTGKPEKFETYVDGLELWYSISVYSPGPEHFVAVFENITERRHADEVLRRSEEKFRQLVASAPDAILCVDQDHRIILANRSASELFGYSVDEFESMDVDLLIPMRLRSTHADHRSGYMTDPRTRRMGSGMEILALRKDGSEFAADISLSHMDTVTGTLVTAFIRNISEHKYLEESLRNQNNVLAALHHISLDLINRYELNDILRALLDKISTMFEASHVSIDLIEEDDVLVTYAVTANQPLLMGDKMRRGEGGWLSWQAIDTGEPAILEDYSTWPKRRELFNNFPIHAVMIIPLKQRDRGIGAINFLRTEANKTFTEVDSYVAQQLAQMVALVLENAQLYTQLQTELTKRIQNEEELQETQTELVANQRTLAVFEERQRMARDLHDSVNQSIHGLVLFSETLVSTLEKKHVERARQIADRLQESARQALKETRLMLYELQPTGPGRNVDLIRDLESRLATVERRAGVKAQISLNGSMDHCPQEWHENLFWITIEALNNALKHAQARNMQVLLRFSGNRVNLEIVDDGIGFDPGKPRPGGLGLNNMRDRAGLLGGELTINSTPKKGSRVRFSAEIKQQ